MARIASGIVELGVHLVEGNTGAGVGGTSRLPHDLSYKLDFASGTDDGQINRVHSVTSTISSTPTDIDLLGSLASEIAGGGTTSLVDLVGIILHNTGSVAVQVGGDTNALAIFGAAADFITVQPGGLFVWLAPAGVAPVASTGDILQLATASSTTTVKVVLLGRSA